MPAAHQASEMKDDTENTYAYNWPFQNILKQCSTHEERNAACEIGYLGLHKHT